MKKTNDTLQQELLKTRKTHKEDKRQQLRKNIEKSSRLLDNYYNPKLHSNHWQISGTVKNKTKYNFSNNTANNDNQNISNNNNNNASSVKKQTQKPRAQHAQTHYLEFDYLDNNDILIIIEHCAYCEKHQSHTNHINDIYKTIAKLIQKSIVARFPFIKVSLKPVDENKLTSRIGALEIQYAMKINNQLTIETLFSKLNSGLWPNIFNILNKISNLVPLFDIKCILYDKEEGNETTNTNQINNNNNEFLLPTKYENIKINLCTLLNPQIQEYSYEAMNAIDIVFNPKRRIMMYHEIKNMSEVNSHYNSRAQTASVRSNSSQRPVTAFYSTSNASFGNNNNSYSALTTYSQSYYNNNNNNSNNTSTFQRSNSFSHLHKLASIDDPDIINSIKGKELANGYTDIEGVLIFNNVPYDSYLIEIENSRNFMQSGCVLKFHKISKCSVGDTKYTMNKVFGLKRQIDAYLEVYIYASKGNDEFDMDLIQGAKVYLMRKYNSDIVGLNSQMEDKLELKENLYVKGMYEIITTPGTMRLIIVKDGYHQTEKVVELKRGENKVNVELQM